MLKKILAMLLAFVMMLSLTACGGNEPTDNDAEPDDGKKTGAGDRGTEGNRGAGRDGGTGENSGTGRDEGTCGNRRTHRRTRRGQRRF